MGIQDAFRKITIHSQEPGEWDRISIDLSKGCITVFLSDKKWLRSKKIISRITKELEEGGGLDFKKLEGNWGYLVYISRTYRSMVPYLKGIHQTLDSWRSGRNEDG